MTQQTSLTPKDLDFLHPEATAEQPESETPADAQNLETTASADETGKRLINGHTHP